MSLYIFRRKFTCINCKVPQTMSVYLFFLTISGVSFIMYGKLYLRNVLANSCLVLAVCIFLDYLVSRRCILTFGVICQFNE